MQLDLTLGSHVMVENNNLPNSPSFMPVLKIGTHAVSMTRFNIGHKGFNLYPGQFVIAVSAEKMVIPCHIDYVLVLDESLRQMGLSVSLANESKPTQEKAVKLIMKNNLQHHILNLTAGMKIGRLRYNFS